jgi:hypothetical protein
MYYAQLDENNICIGVSQLSGKVEATSMITLEQYDISLLGKQYVNGEWINVPQPEPEPQPTEQEILMQTLADMELSNIEAQQERQMLAQQVADLELMILERSNG